MRMILFLVIGLYSLVMLNACGDRDEPRSSPGAVRQYADRYKNKARSVEEELNRSAEARRKVLEESDGESSK